MTRMKNRIRNKLRTIWYVLLGKPVCYRMVFHNMSMDVSVYASDGSGLIQSNGCFVSECYFIGRD